MKAVKQQYYSLTKQHKLLQEEVRSIDTTVKRHERQLIEHDQKINDLDKRQTRYERILDLKNQEWQSISQETKQMIDELNADQDKKEKE